MNGLQIKLNYIDHVSKKLCDNINTDELVAVMFSEVVAKRRITIKNTQGNKKCSLECHQAGTDVASLM